MGRQRTLLCVGGGGTRNQQKKIPKPRTFSPVCGPEDEDDEDDEDEGWAQDKTG